MHFRKLLTKVITYSDFKKFENERFMDSLYLALNSQNIDYTKILDLFFSIYQNRSSHRRCSGRKGILRNFEKLTGKHLCQSIFLNKVVGLLACIFIKNEALAQVLSCEFCKISKNTCFYRTPPGACFCQNEVNHHAPRKNVHPWE